VTTKQIAAKAARAQLPYQLATQIRELLDESKAAAKLSADDWAEVEQKVLELVSEES
jgi:hypothetical protein